MYQFGLLKLFQQLVLDILLHTTMKSISTAQHSSVISPITKSRPGLGKGTVGRISKEWDGNRENNSGSHPSKLSAHDKQSIFCQIKSGRLDNAVQATQFINSVILNPIHPQTVRNVLKESQFYSSTKQKAFMLKQTHCQRGLKFV